MTEKKTVRKWFWVWDFEKEDQWLNEMAQSGWVLESVGFAVYHFAACEPGEYTVRLEMREHDQAYLDLMQESGAEYIGRMAKWIYFRRKAADGPFDIFSDIDSRIDHLTKISHMLGVVAAGNLVIGLSVAGGGHGSLSVVNLLGATLLMYALGRIHGKAEALKKERMLHE